MNARKDVSILVVDDSDTMRALVKKFLKTEGFENIEEAADGDLALIQLNKRDFDVVICDWNMPNKTGLDLLKDLRATTGHKGRTPFIMLTCEVEHDQVEKALLTGANNYIAKPFKKQTLIEKIILTINKDRPQQIT